MTFSAPHNIKKDTAIMVVLEVMSCRVVKRYHLVAGTYCFHLLLYHHIFKDKGVLFI